MSRPWEENEPLEALLGSAHCAGFMFMGRLKAINQYKHGISRRYLFLDDGGRQYEAAGRNAFGEIPVEEPITRVEASLRAMGATLEPPYDSGYIRQKDAPLRAAGIEVLRVRMLQVRIVPEGGAV